MNITENNKVLIAQDLSEYYTIELIEIGNKYFLYQSTNTIFTLIDFGMNKERAIKKFKSIYNRYVAIDRLPMSIIVDKLGIGEQV